MVKAPARPEAALDEQALFREARRLRRRRWGIGLLVVVAAATAVAFGLSRWGGNGARPTGPAGSNPSTPAVAVQPGVMMLNLTKSDKYGDITLVGGRMLLYGPTDEESYPSTSATCNSAVVNPSTLELSGVWASNCANPALVGERVLPVMTVERNVPFGKGGVATVTVRISRVVSGSPGYQLGSVVMTFPQASTGWPTWVYGAGDLWLYDAYNPSGYDLLRISGSTGAVIQRLRLPAVARPILAFDADGFWLAPAVNSTGPAVYHVPLGARSATAVLDLPGAEYVAWMVASGHSVWLDVSSGGRTGTLLHLTGTAAEVSSRFAMNSFDNEVETQGGASTMVGSGADGLWTILVTQAGTKQEVVRIDPDSGLYGTVASLEPGYATTNVLLDGDFWKAVTLDGSMYLLDPPTDSGSYPYQAEAFSALYRITRER
ncbi:MAG: hypothetical protein ABSE77_15925 [Acidimicrobiales bacterium]